MAFGSTSKAEEFVRKQNQDIKSFLLSSAPKDRLHITHFTKAPIKLNGKELLVAVYELSDFNSRSGNDERDRQQAFAFIQKDKNRYERILITGLYDDGGSPFEILAIFTAKFKQNSDPDLGFLIKWDSSHAGGHSVMERVGVNYFVFPFSFNGKEFTKIESPVVTKLGGCDCSILNENGEVTGHEKAAAKDVTAIKKQLRGLGIQQ